jgi:anti-sigma factor RsiW
MAAVADPACKKLFALLSEFLDGELPPADCRRLKRHLQSCKPCLAYLKTLETTAGACRKLGEMGAGTAPPELISRVLSLLQDQKVQRYKGTVPVKRARPFRRA